MNMCLVSWIYINKHTQGGRRERKPFQSAGTFGLVISAPHSTEVVSNTLQSYHKCQVSSQEFRENVICRSKFVIIVQAYTRFISVSVSQGYVEPALHYINRSTFPFKHALVLFINLSSSTRDYLLFQHVQ